MVGGVFYWPLPLLRGGLCWEVSMRVNVWNVRQEEKSWPLWGRGCCREVAVSRDSTVLSYTKSLIC